MADVFKNTTMAFGGAFAADKGVITRNVATGIDGVLMQQLQLQYSQQVTRVYELGTEGQAVNVYLVGGRSQGQATIGRIIGPKVMLKRFYEKFSDVCGAKDNDLQLRIANKCPGDAQASYTCKYCVLTQIGVSLQANDLMINENSAVQFSNMEYSEGGSSNLTAQGPNIIG